MKRWLPSSETIRLLAVGLCLGGIVHICATFAMPALTGRSAYTRLSQTLPLNALTILPPVTPRSQPLPFIAGDSRYAMCRYDTRESPVNVDVTLPDAGWLLALYSPQGDNFYYVPGESGRSNRINLLLVPPGEVGQPSGAGGSTAPRAGEPSLVPTREGIVVVKAPVRGISYDAALARDLTGIRCQPLQTR